MTLCSLGVVALGGGSARDSPARDSPARGRPTKGWLMVLQDFFVFKKVLLGVQLFFGSI